MTDYDVFNGDADGICSLVQLRNAEPREATLITGVKRDIELLDRVQAGTGDRVTVLDVSLDKNRDALARNLAAGAEVFYVDHHFAGDIPRAANLETIINEAADVCTSILINHHLRGAYREWAVVGAFGDNLKKSASTLAAPLSLSADRLQQLENLGIYINYNGYGESLADLHFPPEELFLLVSAYASPFDFMTAGREHFARLEEGYHQDMATAANTKPLVATEKTALLVLPAEPWARRVSGVYSNDLSNQFPARAHAVLTEKPSGNYLVSVRAPLNNKRGAADLCRKFPTGGGREAAAGINDLPAAMLDTFIEAFTAQFS